MRDKLEGRRQRIIRGETTVETMRFSVWSVLTYLESEEHDADGVLFLNGGLEAWKAKLLTGEYQFT